uniref:Uncharacterized protein n=1 Tax=Kapraunia schneideri TaxID=717899 RepID=A0A1Z1MSM4_9FLOR|nr:hypothetical protein [Kapraunia schneideri]ARW68879.1 hypothetical protein [Kapraunia schneideri]
MDNTYFSLRIVRDHNIEIYLYCHNYQNSLFIHKYYPICFIFNTDDFNKIVSLLSICLYFIYCSSNHKLYLGKEIYKALITIKINQPYIQD